jgi:hypothetical protein
MATARARGAHSPRGRRRHGPVATGPVDGDGTGPWSTTPADGDGTGPGRPQPARSATGTDLWLQALWAATARARGPQLLRMATARGSVAHSPRGRRPVRTCGYRPCGRRRHGPVVHSPLRTATARARWSTTPADGDGRDARVAAVHEPPQLGRALRHEHRRRVGGQSAPPAVGAFAWPGNPVGDRISDSVGCGEAGTSDGSVARSDRHGRMLARGRPGRARRSRRPAWPRPDG